jgi:PST family polysaccharide transporter
MFWTLSGTGVQGLVQLLVLMALGRLLTPAQFGVMGAAMVVVALSRIVSQVGVGPAIVQRRDLTRTHVRVAVTLSFSLGLILGAVVYLGAPVIARFYRIPDVGPVLRCVAFLFPLEGLNTVGKALLTRDLRFRTYAALDAGSYILGYAIVGVVLAWYGQGVWALVIATLCQSAVRTVAMFAIVRHPLRPSLNLAASRELLSFGFGHSLGQIGVVLSQQSDNFLVGRWLGPAALGIYGRAYSLMVMPTTIFGLIVLRVLFPLMSQLQNEPRRLGNAYERGLAVVALVSLPISSFLWVLAPEFINVVLGPAWHDVILPFRLFTISLLFRMSSRISDECAKAAGKVYHRAALQWTYAGLVVLGAAIGQQWGLGGVAVGVSVAMAANWLSMVWLCRAVTGLTWARFGAAHLPAALLAGLIVVAAAPVAQAMRVAHLGSVPVLTAAGLAAAGVAWAAARLRPDIMLGPHGLWAFKRAEHLVLRRSARMTLAAEKSNPE